MKPPLDFEVREADIAIIGLACRFPGANNPDRFWQNLKDGIDSIEVFEDGELDIGDRDCLNDPNYVKAGAVLDDVKGFDADFFGYSATEAELIDPQQRIFLECAWEAMENAGYNPDNYTGRAGIYAGSGMNTYLLNNVHPNRGFSTHRTFLQSMVDVRVRLGNAKFCLPTRTAYKLNFTGPSVNVQTACSTSLVAVHMACQSLLNGECDLALAGGAAIAVPQKVGYFYQDGMISAPDGKCRAFDADAKGTVFGNGVGVVILKSLEQAIEDGDPIHAVIKGSAVNNDGALKVGYTAPSVEGQAIAISEALAVAEVEANTISYVEAHGTGTTLGDPIEMTALTQAFRETTDETQFCAIGSVKTNIGHLAEAAGISGLIKTVLALKHKQIPPSLHFNRPNPNINFNNSPFFVNNKLANWNSGETPRRAGVSSFGMGGTNCHIVLEEAPQRQRQPETQSRYLLPLSAKTPQALQELARRYVDFFDSEPDADLGDICFTASSGRKHFQHRWAIVAASKADLKQQLSNFNTLKAANIRQKQASTIAFLFTGQGSQYFNMGRQLYDTQPSFRENINRCGEILEPYLSEPLHDIIYSNNPKLNRTDYTQPALFAIEYALAQLWMSWGIHPDVVMGHSVGEYVAACIAGVFSLEDGLKLIAERGRLMQSLPQEGAMVSLLASEAKVREAIQAGQNVSIAAINGGNSTVISGKREDVNAIAQKFAAEGIKTKELNVSHAFHSALMEPILDNFAEVARQVTLNVPQIQLISNITGEVVNHEVTQPNYWRDHIRKPVNFLGSMNCLDRLNVGVLLEIGAKPILLGMGRHCLPEHQGLWLPSLRPDRDDWEQMLGSLAQLYLNGFAIDWSSVYQNSNRRRTCIPTYPFQRKPYWIEAIRGSFPTPNASPSNQLHPLIDRKLDLAGSSEIRFQARLSLDRPAWIGEHRYFGQSILPGMGYLEMAIAASKLAFKWEQPILEAVSFQQALIFSQGQSRTVQIVLKPDGDRVCRFEIYSRGDTDEDWQIHASGRINSTSRSPLSQLDLTALKPQCPNAIDPNWLYQQFERQGLEYGNSFRAIAEIWHGSNIALGKIELPDNIAAELDRYSLHPVLSDICVQILEAISPDRERQNSYVPVGLERLRILAPSSPQTWGYARLREVEGKHQQKMSADFYLFDVNGEAIAILEGLKIQAVNRTELLDSTQPNPSQDWLYQIQWRSQPLPPPTSDSMLLAPKNGQPRHWLIFADNEGIAQQLKVLLQQRQDICTLVWLGSEYRQKGDREFQLNPSDPQQFRQLCQDVPPFDRVIHLWSLNSPQTVTSDDLETAVRMSCGSTLHLIQALTQSDRKLEGLWLVAKGSQTVNQFPVTHIEQSPIWGMGKAIALEYPQMNCIRVDLDNDSTVNWAEILDLEIEYRHRETESEDQIAYRDRTRYVPRLVRYLPNAKPSHELNLSPDRTYLITGGLGDLGLLVAQWLVEKGAKNLVLLGRSEPKPNARDRIQELQQSGIHVVIARADVANFEQMQSAFDRIGRSMPPLKGIIHAAGAIADGTLPQQTWQKFAKVLSPKVQGAWNLHRLTQDTDLDFFVLFSSGTSLLGFAGQSNYIAANTFLDRLAWYRQSQGLPALTINWGAWAEIGMAAKHQQQVLQRLEQKGIYAFSPPQGLAILEQLILEQPTQVGVISMDWNRFARHGWANVPLFDELTQDLVPSEQPDIARQLANANWAEGKTILTDFISHQVAKLLGLNAQQNLDIKQPLVDFGFDSLASVELRNNLQSSLGCSLRSTLLFDYPTIDDLANHLGDRLLAKSKNSNSRSRGDRESLSTLVPIQPHGVQPPWFVVPGVLGSVFELYPLSRCLGSEQPVYGLRSLGLEEDIEPLTAIEAIAAHHIQWIETIQPQGKYFIAGHSFGGKVAFEIAQQLIQQGKEVAKLVLMDIPATIPDTEKDAANWSNAKYLSQIASIYGGALGRDLQIHENKLENLSLDEQLNYAVRQFQRIGQNLPKSQMMRILQVYKANTQAHTQYIPREIDGVSVTLLRAKQLSQNNDFLPDEATTFADPSWGWHQLTRQPLEFHLVPGNHFTMIKEPQVKSLAQHLLCKDYANPSVA